MMFKLESALRLLAFEDASFVVEDYLLFESVYFCRGEKRHKESGVQSVTVMLKRPLSVDSEFQSVLKAPLRWVGFYGVFARKPL